MSDFVVPPVVQELLDELAWKPKGDTATKEEVVEELFLMYEAACLEVLHYFTMRRPEGTDLYARIAVKNIGHTIRWVEQIKKAFEALGYDLTLPEPVN